MYWIVIDCLKVFIERWNEFFFKGECFDVYVYMMDSF